MGDTFPGDNQDRPMASPVLVATSFPTGRTEIVGKQGDTGAIKIGKTEFAVGPQSVNTSTEFLHYSTN